MNNWDELRTAYHLAKYQTVSATAEALDIHRATVIRHVDSLELELGCKLFQRHNKGYTITEIGEDLLNTTGMIDSQLKQFKARVKGHDEVSGEFIITSLEYIAPLLLPVIQDFQTQHPQINVRYLTSQDLFKLEYGQAHIAIRTGTKPEHPDYVVMPFKTLDVGLFAHQTYIEKYGLPKNINDWTRHCFITSDDDNPKPAVQKWLKQQIPSEKIVFRSNRQAVQQQAVLAGIGIGAMLVHEADQYNDLVEVYPRDSQWAVPNWLVTHGDLHRSEKVQRFLAILKNRSENR